MEELQNNGELSNEVANAILKEAWESAPEEVKEKILNQNKEIEEAKEAELPEYFRTLSEGQCKEFCTSGKCQADCCGCVPFPKQYFKALKKLIPAGNTYSPYEYRDRLNGFSYIKPLTKNGKCVFLTSENLCAIYGSHLRPQMCRNFGMDASNPLTACVHINEEFKDLIEEYGHAYLDYLASTGNSIASHIKRNQ